CYDHGSSEPCAAVVEHAVHAGPWSSFEARCGLAVMELDAVVAVECLDGGADVAPEHSLQRQVPAVEHVDLQAGGAKGGGHLASDESRADHDGPGALESTSTDAIGILAGSQVEHPVQIPTGDVEPAVPRPGGDEEAVVANALAGLEFDLPRTGMDATRPEAKSEFDVVLEVPLERAQDRVVERRLAAQVRLREGWALVGRMRLGPDQDDLRVGAVFAERSGGSAAGQVRTDDDERLACH